MKRKRRVGRAVWLLAAAALLAAAWGWWRVHPGSKRELSAAESPVKAIAPMLPAPRAETNRFSSPPTEVRTQTNQPSVGLTQANSNGLPASARAAQPLPAETPRSEPAPTALVSDAKFPRPVQTGFELQVALARRALSPGSIDGLIGPQTRVALKSFQQQAGLPITGELDDATRSVLWLTNPPTRTYPVGSNDLARLEPLSTSWLGKSRQNALEYETLLELVSEKSEASPSLIRRLNPRVDWGRVTAGTCLELPEANVLWQGTHADSLTIRLKDKILEAWDVNGKLMAHFPCSIARLVEKRPVGELHVVVIARNPNYTFDPANFPESAEAQTLNTKLILPPGPNNPVGSAWIGLDRPGYGIHGTPQPELVGRTESHGCFRLANWNAEYLANLVTIGTPVRVLP